MHSVGVSGHFTSGGYGMNSHQQGLALDFVEGATIVLANGSVVETSATQHEDLFWAILGAGANFGIVVSWRLRTFEAPDMVTLFRVELNWNRSTAAGYLAAIERYINNDMPQNLSIRISDRTSGQLVAEGLYYGSEAENKSNIDAFLSISNGTLVRLEQCDWISSIKRYVKGEPFDDIQNDININVFDRGPVRRVIVSQVFVHFRS